MVSACSSDSARPNELPSTRACRRGGGTSIDSHPSASGLRSRENQIEPPRPKETAWKSEPGCAQGRSPWAASSKQTSPVLAGVPVPVPSFQGLEIVDSPGAQLVGTRGGEEEPRFQ